jgi:hypothetical protein
MRASSAVRAQDEAQTPIKQDVKNGKLRVYPWNIHWHYGMLPQTWCAAGRGADAETRAPSARLADPWRDGGREDPAHASASAGGFFGARPCQARAAARAVAAARGAQHLIVSG